MRIAACDFHGNVHGAGSDGVARFLSEDDGPRVQRLLRRKYPVARRLLSWVAALSAAARLTQRETPAYLEIRTA